MRILVMKCDADKACPDRCAVHMAGSIDHGFGSRYRGYLWLLILYYEPSCQVYTSGSCNLSARPYVLWILHGMMSLHTHIWTTCNVQGTRCPGFA